MKLRVKREEHLRDGFLSLCDSDILLINLHDPLMSCVLRLFRLAFGGDYERYKAVTVQRLCTAALKHCVD